ncbi:hypothetical protein Pla111_08860 [Botrimarina hoheduenensis]|uniref:Uncharacterized protein n=1 Tax=Botrimarina hoheduenensis TaxID=2528000 RepID=A0A5C5WAD7_9BACT|nr:hypothetical protein Pla111_08860 [Botrimarina hoheduenensis]
MRIRMRRAAMTPLRRSDQGVPNRYTQATQKAARKKLSVFFLVVYPAACLSHF